MGVLLGVSGRKHFDFAKMLLIEYEGDPGWVSLTPSPFREETVAALLSIHP